MDIENINITKLRLTNIERLDPIDVYPENFGKGQGQITITCYGKAWTAYWGGMGDQDINEFFCSCDEHYIAKNLSDIKAEVYDIEKIREDAEKKGVECYRDDPWNDYEFLNAMYGGDMMDWHDSLPKESNHEYEYLCRIIKAVQSALKQR